LILKNKAGDLLYTNVNSLFDKDSLKVLDENDQELQIIPELRQNVPAFWEFNARSIYNSETDESAFNSEICRKFIIKYYFNEAETITTCFIAKKFTCGSEFSYLKVYQNGVLIGGNSDNLRVIATVVKN
jgi:hypothetical protein